MSREAIYCYIDTMREVSKGRRIKKIKLNANNLKLESEIIKLMIFIDTNDEISI